MKTNNPTGGSINIHFSATQLIALEAVAKVDGKSLEDWCRDVVLDAAKVCIEADGAAVLLDA